METILVFKWTRDPVDSRVGVNGEVVWGQAKMAATDDDPAALEAACNVTPAEEIIGLTVGDGDPAWAAARGIGKTVIVDGVTCDYDGAAVGSALAAAISKISDSPRVFIGDSDWNYSVVSALAGALRIPTFAGVTAVEASGDTLLLTCKTGSSNRVVSVDGPVLVAVKGQSADTNTPGMKQILQGRKKPKENWDVATLEGVRGGAASVSETRAPERDRAILIDGTDPQAAAAELVGMLRREGIL